MAEWTKNKNRIQLQAVYERYTLDSRTQTGLKQKDGKYRLCKLAKRAGVAILLSDKTNFKTNIFNRDKEGHFIRIGFSLTGRHHNYKHILPNNRAPNCREQNFTDVRTGSMFAPATAFNHMLSAPLCLHKNWGKFHNFSSPFQLFKPQESLKCHLKFNLNLVSSFTSSGNRAGILRGKGRNGRGPQSGQDNCSHPLMGHSCVNDRVDAAGSGGLNSF